MMTETRQKLAEAKYFFDSTNVLFNRHSFDFEFHLNAFLNAARNVTFVMQKEYDKVVGFRDWWSHHPSKQDGEMKKFVELRNISVKQRSVGHELFSIRIDFGPEGLKVSGKNGPTSVKSEVMSLDGPIPEFTNVTVNDDSGERIVKARIIHDFSVVERYEVGTKEVSFDSFLVSSREHMGKLEHIVQECEGKFGTDPVIK